MRKWIFAVFIFCIFLLRTFIDVKFNYKILHDIEKNIKKHQFLDRNLKQINITYQNAFNLHHEIRFNDINKKFIQILLFSEDKDFYSHGGVDWVARFKALYLNIKNLKVKMGASTISEQVIRILHHRDRKIWSKWIEGIEANLLERNVAKNEILEFYINQVPFSNNIRGFELASRYYFDRSFKTLSLRERIFLIINIRAPSSFDFYKNKDFRRVERYINKFAGRLRENGIIDDIEYEEILSQKLIFKKNDLNIDANHFISFVKNGLNVRDLSDKHIVTTLDSGLQSYVNNVLFNSIKRFFNSGYNVKNGAALIVKRRNMEVLSYNSVSLNKNEDGSIDSVQALRQPASTLKPFLYGLALDKKLTLASKIDDSPMYQHFNNGVHQFFNASHKFYGLVSVREALANSLNIPAIKVLNFVGVQNFYFLLKSLNFNHLNHNYDYYNLGLAIGGLESNLFEIVRAYGVLANNGVFQEINFLKNRRKNNEKKYILSPESTSLITLVLSDKLSRRIEFSRDSALNFPMKVAIKTGTSNDYKDSWAIGYNGDYIVGVWLGNLDYQSMNSMSGALGPGFILRNIFEELYKFYDVENNFNSNDNIIRKRVENYDEYFVANNQEVRNLDYGVKRKKILQPNNNLEIVIDPHVPLAGQKIELIASNIEDGDEITWEFDGKKIHGNLIDLNYGRHSLLLKVVDTNGNISTDLVSFTCK